MFTLEQIEEIHRKLQLFGVKDMDLPTLTEQLDGSEVLTLIKNGRNIQLMVSQFLNFDMFTPELLESLRGPQGLDGKNAYQTWLEQGNVGTYDDYLTILQLPALTASETLTITVNNKLDEADDVIIKLNNKNEEMQLVISEANIAKDIALEVVTHPPTIINDYWHLWNHVTNQYDTTYVKAAGDTAYEIWLAEGNTGTKAEYLAAIKGNTGKYGETKFVINDNMELEQHTLIGDQLNFSLVDDDLVLTEGGETVNLGTVAIKDTYSYDEQRIGTWVNGKPIYRKVFLFPNPDINDTISIVHNLNVDTYIRMDIASNCFNMDYQASAPLLVSTTPIQTNMLVIDQDTIILQSVTVNTAYTYHLIIEYTKL